MPLTPPETLARLKDALAENGFIVLAEIEGAAVSDRLPEDYQLLYVAVPAAAAKAVELDAAAPSALAIPFSVFGVEGGTCVVAIDPVASRLALRRAAAQQTSDVAARAARQGLRQALGEIRPLSAPPVDAQREPAGDQGDRREHDHGEPVPAASSFQPFCITSIA